MPSDGAATREVSCTASREQGEDFFLFLPDQEFHIQLCWWCRADAAKLARVASLRAVPLACLEQDRERAAPHKGSPVPGSSVPIGSGGRAVILSDTTCSCR